MTAALLFFALGDPVPGPNYQDEIAWKQTASLVALALTAVMLLVGATFGGLGRKDSPGWGLAALSLSGLWFLLVALSLVGFAQG